jgi:threonine dehydrogenase-like Zn-dependent dehydrogenase
VRAAVFAGVGRLELQERPEPEAGGEEELLLEVEACGVCGTDLKILADPPGHPATVGVVLGHEFVGRAGGRRFVVAPNVACGRCEQCRRGLRNQCERFTTLGVFRDGGLAPLVLVPAANCHPISDEVPPELAALAEPLSTVVHGVRQLRPFPGERALVLGAGPIGLMFVALLRRAGCRVGVVEPSEARRALAGQLGAEEVERAELVVDAVGSQLPAALERVERGGRILLFGVDSRARAEIAQEQITRDELTIIGSFVGQDVFPAAVSLLESGLELAPLVTHRIGLDELPAALDELRAGRAVKVEVLF